MPTPTNTTSATVSHLDQSLTAAQNPAAQVGDRSSSIRITRLTATWVNPCVFVKIETNHGIVGWGEAFAQGLEPPEIAAKAIEVALTVRTTPNPSFRRVDAQVFDAATPVLNITTVLGRY